MKLVNISYPEAYECKLTLAVDAQAFENAIQAEYEQKRATVKLKGLARGQANRAQIEAERGADFFWFDAAEALIDAETPAIYDGIVAEHALEVVSECTYDIVSVDKEEGFVFTVAFCLLPTFSFGAYKDMVITKKSAVVTDEEVEKVVAAKKDLTPEAADEYRAEVRQRMEENKRLNAEMEAKSAMIRRLAEFAEGEVPSMMVNDVHEDRLNHLNEFLQQQKVSMEEFLKQAGHTEEELRADSLEGATAHVRATLALIRLGKELGFTPSKEEVEAEILVRAARIKEKVSDFTQKADRRKVAISIIRQRATEYLWTKIKVVHADEAATV